MKKLLFIFSTVCLIASCNAPETAEGDTNTEQADSTNETAKTEKVEPRKSPSKQAQGIVDGVQMTVDYCSPYVKGRTVWGDLVPYNELWRAGANETTALTVDNDILIGGDTLKAGTYGFFILPKENADWTIVINEAWDKKMHGIWGTYNYDNTKDVMRFDVTPEWRNDVVESLNYFVSDSGLEFSWEKAFINIPFKAI
jgi:hypothetical protein